MDTWHVFYKAQNRGTLGQVKETTGTEAFINTNMRSNPDKIIKTKIKIKEIPLTEHSKFDIRSPWIS